MKFTIEKCDVTVGGAVAAIIENNCYSTALGVSMMQEKWRVNQVSRFAYKSFVSTNRDRVDLNSVQMRVATSS